MRRLNVQAIMSAMSPARVVAPLTAVPLLIGLLTGCGPGAQEATQPVPVSAENAQGSGPVQGHNGVDPVPVGTPCSMAVHGDPLEIAATREAPVYWPRSGADEITEAWRCADTPVFMFGEVQVSFEGGWEGVQIRQKFQALADAYGGSVETIQGLAAWVVGSTPNDEVLMIKDGSAIRLVAPGDVPIERLVTLAKALDLANPVNR